ncbi:oligosaccharide repeat unit polymerase [Priestia megaterium NCT-2]|uniref:O-antigen polymerase n=1 Tax=Priestia megaterium TaxID=1404 RepID=UPI000344DF15|nr:O-antigen polymerase [Priestia megaterium]AYE52409.1 oligosaccharide repeat unit polymerase [Priestia megaterium NCT-2]
MNTNSLAKSIYINTILRTLLNISILLFLLIFSYFTWNNINYINSWAKIISSISILLISYHLLVFYFLKITYTDFRLWFIVLSNLFMFGRVYLIAYNLNDNIFWDLLDRYPKDLLYNSGLFVLCCIHSLFIGFTMVSVSESQSNKQIFFLENIKEENLRVLLYNTGFIMVLFSFSFRIMEDFTTIRQAQSSGSYSSLSTSSGFTDDFAMMFIPGIVYMICSQNLKRKTNLLILTLIIAYFVTVMILTGDRRYPVTSIIAVVLCYMAVYNIKFSFRKSLSYLIGGSLLLNFLAIIRDIRASSLTSPSAFFGEYWNILLTNNPIYETLAEFGLSFVSLVGAMKNIPDVLPYQNGLGFYGAIPSLLPIGWLYGGFFQKVSISRTINNIEQYPVGASFFSEFYANFGWLSVGLVIIFGFVIAKIFVINSDKNKNYYIAKHFALFYIIINLVRSSFFEIFRPTMMVYFLPLIIMYVIYDKHKSRLR